MSITNNLYIIVKEPTVKMLERKVNDLLKLDYVPQGGISSKGTLSGGYMQAMIKQR